MLVTSLSGRIVSYYRNIYNKNIAKKIILSLDYVRKSYIIIYFLKIITYKQKYMERLTPSNKDISCHFRRIERRFYGAKRKTDQANCQSDNAGAV
jgi:hypothetical protein